MGKTWTKPPTRCCFAATIQPSLTEYASEAKSGEIWGPSDRAQRLIMNPTLDAHVHELIDLQSLIAGNLN